MQNAQFRGGYGQSTSPLREVGWPEAGSIGCLASSSADPLRKNVLISLPIVSRHFRSRCTRAADNQRYCSVRSSAAISPDPEGSASLCGPRTFSASSKCYSRPRGVALSVGGPDGDGEGVDCKRSFALRCWIKATHRVGSFWLVKSSFRARSAFPRELSKDSGRGSIACQTDLRANSLAFRFNISGWKRLLGGTVPDDPVCLVCLDQRHGAERARPPLKRLFSGCILIELGDFERSV